MKRKYPPSLILALGTLAATALSALASEPQWLVLAGPVVLAGAIVAVGVVERRTGPRSGASMRTALVLGVLFAATGIIMWFRDPSQVPFTVAILGGASVVTLGRSRPCDQDRLDSARSA